MRAKLLIISLLCVTMNTFANVQSCDGEIAAINKKIAAAKSVGNAKEVAGLRIALEQVQTNCNNHKQIIKAKQEIAENQAHVNIAKNDLTTAEQQLQSAQAKGNKLKIIHANSQVNHKKLKLHLAQENLQLAKDDLKKLNDN